MVGRHIRIENYCIVCRQYVSHIRFDDEWYRTPNVGFDTQRPPLLCLYNTEPFQSPKRKVRAFHIRDWRLYGRYDRFEGYCQPGPPLPPEACSSCTLDDVFYVAHICCVQLAQQHFGAELSARALYTFTLLTRPIFSAPFAFNLSRSSQPSRIPDCGLSSETDLGALLESLRTRLPIELQEEVLKYLTGTHFLALTGGWQALECFRNLQLKKFSSRLSWWRVFADSSPPTSIGADFHDVLGESYIFRMGVGSGPKKWDLNISLSGLEVTGLQFALGTSGIQAIRIRYNDDSVSPWLGQPRRAWYGFIKFNDFSRLHVLKDDMKFVRLGIANAYCNGYDSSNPRHPVLWDREMPCLGSLRHEFISTDGRGALLFQHRDARVMKYLSIRPDARKARGITMYCGMYGVYEIAADSDEKRQLGSAKNSVCPIYFQLRPGETIQSIHTLTLGNKPLVNTGPFLWFTTNKDRTLCFAPHTARFKGICRFSNIWAKEGEEIVGLFSDPTTKRSTETQMGNIGVSFGPSEDASPAKRPRTIAIPTLPSLQDVPLPHRGTRAFLSKANLLNVASLKVRRVKRSGRCTGLCIERHDGTIDVLGQWDPRDSDMIEPLYYASSGVTLDSLTFIFYSYVGNQADHHRNGPYERYVQDILIAPPWDNGGKAIFTWSDTHRELAWWFTSGQDFLEYWTGSVEVAGTEVDFGTSGSYFEPLTLA